MSVEVANETEWQLDPKVFSELGLWVMHQMRVSTQSELTITFVDPEPIAELHERWMDLQGPTDVMSFPMDELTPGYSRPDGATPGPAMLGDIVLCPEFAAKQATKAGHDLAHELALLTVHGSLHLLGYDHVDPAEEREMFALQNELLADWYDNVEARGVTYQPKPSGAGAFPTAADRLELDEKMEADDSGFGGVES